MNDKALAQVAEEHELFRPKNSQELREGLKYMVAVGLATSMEEAFIKAWAGHRMGLDPMEAITGLDIIPSQDGRKKVRPSSALLHRRARQHPDFESMSIKATPKSATVVLRRRGAPEPFEVTWSIDEVPDELLRKNNWQNYPRAMLKARAIREAVLDAFPELAGSAGDEAPDEDGQAVPAAVRVAEARLGAPREVERVELDQPVAWADDGPTMDGAPDGWHLEVLEFGESGSRLLKVETPASVTEDEVRRLLLSPATAPGGGGVTLHGHRTDGAEKRKVFRVLLRR